MKTVYTVVIFAVIFGLNSCQKFLDEKTDKKLVVPQTLADLQAILDDFSILSYEPYSGEIAGGDYYLTDADWKGISIEEYRRGYLWEKEYGTYYIDWANVYRGIYYANVILDHLEKIPANTQEIATWNDVKGQALFLRARLLLATVGIWSKAYNPTTASTDPGIPIRTGSNFNEVSQRATVEETYRQIISDLTEAAELLNVQNTSIIRSSQAAAFALLSRVYLYMGDYQNSFTYADKCLDIKGDLIDYNEITSSPLYPFSEFNKEVIYAAWLQNPMPLSINYAKVDTNLIALYDNNDYRKTLFLRNNNNGSFSFRGSYTGSLTPFAGLGVDEVILTRAECAVRLDNAEQAVADLNSLLENRWKKRDGSSTYLPYDNSLTAEELLDLILKERRKELLLRGVRWPDIKRLNRDGANIVLERTIDGKRHVLPPNDPRYALPIPEEVLRNSNLQQNNY